MPASREVTLLYLIKQVELAVRARLDDAVGSAGLTPLQYTALTVLERRPGLTSAELARKSFVRAQTMAQMIGFLEAKGLLRRETDENSRRQFLLFLTERGSATIDALRPAVDEVERDLVDGLTTAQVAELRETLWSARQRLGGSPSH
jgi:DNA-binding MarR family transcriptional regulator